VTASVKFTEPVEAIKKDRTRDKVAAAVPATIATAEPTACAKFAEPVEAIKKGRTRDKVAAAAGVSGFSYEKAKTVIEAAEADSKRFGDGICGPQRWNTDRKRHQRYDDFTHSATRSLTQEICRSPLRRR
jgi:hypothetical protein